MAQVTVNIRMDKKLKDNMERTCKEMGLTTTAVYTMFATKVTKEKRIPFEIAADPFYSLENQESLLRSIKQLNDGKGTEHELIGVN